VLEAREHAAATAVAAAVLETTVVDEADFEAQAEVTAPITATIAKPAPIRTHRFATGTLDLVVTLDPARRTSCCASLIALSHPPVADAARPADCPNPKIRPRTGPGQPYSIGRPRPVETNLTRRRRVGTIDAWTCQRWSCLARSPWARRRPTLDTGTYADPDPAAIEQAGHELEAARRQAIELAGDGPESDRAARMQLFWAGYLAGQLAARPELAGALAELPALLGGGTPMSQTGNVYNSISGTVRGNVVQAGDIGSITFGR
jgi:hypothetical protein